MSDKDIVIKFKLGLARICCNSLLDPPLPFVEALRYRGDESKETRAKMQSEHERQKADREKKRIEREPELLQELDAIVERVKLSRSEESTSVQEKGEYAFGASRKSLPRVDKNDRALSNYSCQLCGNKDPTQFTTDISSGDVICRGARIIGQDGVEEFLGCGNVVQEHYVEVGAEKRNFEGEEDRNHFGPTPNALMPDSENMRTTIVVGRGQESQFKNIAQNAQMMEMNLSKVGNDDRRTRVGYKTQHKKKAFELMDQMAANLNIHPLIVEGARVEFARYRDLKEAVYQFEGVVAACIILSYTGLLHQRTSEELLNNKVAYSNETNDFFAQQSSAAALHKSTDIAIVTLQDIPMIQWNNSQVELWCLAVGKHENSKVDGEGNQSAREQTLAEVSEQINGHLRTQQQGQASNATIAAGKPSSSEEVMNCFGSTTVADRNKRSFSQRQSATGNGSDLASAGKLFARLNLFKLFNIQENGSNNSNSNQMDVASSGGSELSSKELTALLIRHIKAGVKRRQTHEIQHAAEKVKHEQEEKRLRCEPAMNVLLKLSKITGGDGGVKKESGNIVTQSTLGTPFTSVDIGGLAETMSATLEEDDMFLAALSSPSIAVPASTTPTTTSRPVKKEVKTSAEAAVTSSSIAHTATPSSAESKPTKSSPAAAPKRRFVIKR